LLKHLFALPQESLDAHGSEKREGAGGELAGTPAEAAANPIQLRPLSGGFSLSRRGEATRVPRVITVWMAYEVRNGNPFKQYTLLDFNVCEKPLRVRLKGARLQFCSGNAIQIRVERGDFQLSVTGFDPHRDLRVKTRP
jgi:hypothetical protein